MFKLIFFFYFNNTLRCYNRLKKKNNVNTLHSLAVTLKNIKVYKSVIADIVVVYYALWEYTNFDFQPDYEQFQTGGVLADT